MKVVIDEASYLTLSKMAKKKGITVETLSKIILEYYADLERKLDLIEYEK